MTQEPLKASARAPATAMSEAASVARREPETTASRGMATIQRAAAEFTPPVRAARQTTSPVRPAEERACAIQRWPARESSTAARIGRNRLAMPTHSMPEGTPRHTR